MIKEKTQRIHEEADLAPFIAALIASNVYDYVYGSKAIQQIKKESEDTTSREYVTHSRMKNEALSFFKSGWFTELTLNKVDAEYLIEKCDQAVALEKYGTIKRKLDSGKTKQYKYVFCFETLTEDELKAFKGVLDKEDYKKLETKFKNNIPVKKNIALRMFTWAERLVLDTLTR